MIAGVDEAGRGALAGPVVAAAVVLPDDFDVSCVADSKSLDVAGREAAFEALMASGVDYGVGIASHRVVDRINVLKATMKTMQISVRRLAAVPSLVLVDGNRSPGFGDVDSRAIVKGDATEPCISAASIVAKVIRDRLMVRQNTRYPGYGFDQHKGYGTATHYQCIEMNGLSGIHRKSFNYSKQLGLF